MITRKPLGSLVSLYLIVGAICAEGTIVKQAPITIAAASRSRLERVRTKTSRGGVLTYYEFRMSLDQTPYRSASHSIPSSVGGAI
jgi:hypothetical protein